MIKQIHLLFLYILHRKESGLLTKRLVRCKQVVIESMNKFNSNNERDFKQDESIRVERMQV